MTEEERPKCNVDDIVCQAQVLAHLKGMQSLLGEEKFKSDFPEFEGMGEKLTERIRGEETKLEGFLDRCGLSGIIEVPIVDETEEEE